MIIMVRKGPARGIQTLTPLDARAIARDAYIYGFPLVDSYRVQHSYFVDRGGQHFKTTWNQVFHEPLPHAPENANPDSCMCLSHLGADLRAEPLLLTLPVIGKDRVASVRMIDAYTSSFARLRCGAEGNAGGTYLVAGPSWRGAKPFGVKNVIRCETELAFIVYRTQLVGPDDIENVERVQAGYAVRTLSAFLGKTAPPPPLQVEFMKPLTRELQRTSLEFFEVLNFVLRFCPTHPSENDLMARFASIGVGAHATFNARTLSPELRNAIASGMMDAWMAFADFKKAVDADEPAVGYLAGTSELVNNDYLSRMGAAALGNYGNPEEETTEPARQVTRDPDQPERSREYTIQFAREQLKTFVVKGLEG